MQSKEIEAKFMKVDIKELRKNHSLINKVKKTIITNQCVKNIICTPLMHNKKIEILNI